VLSEIGKRTEETLQKHLQAFGSGDVDAVMADYDETAVFIKQDGTLRGTDEIRSFFETLVADLPPGSTLDVSEQIVEEEIAYIVWSGESEKVKIPFATDTFIVRDGKIVAQTLAAQMEKKASA
jgi:SnoaL-like domain